MLVKKKIGKNRTFRGNAHQENFDPQDQDQHYPDETKEMDVSEYLLPQTDD